MSSTPQTAAKANTGRKDVPDRPTTTLVRRARRIGRELAAAYPNARCELNYGTPFQLLVATILSAQCTDVRVNQVTPALFAAYPDAPAFAAADRSHVEDLIRSTGFFRAKTNSILGMSQAVCEKFGGEVPNTLQELVTLPGVGRKTANVILGDAFGVPGITVDTHVGRLARRFEWTTNDDPVKVEFDIMALFPKKDWTVLSHRLIFHGRRCCFARRPACGACPLAQVCPSFGEGVVDPVKAEKMLKPASAFGGTE